MQISNDDGKKEVWKLPIRSMLQQRMREPDIALQDICLAAPASLGLKESAAGSEAHAFNPTIDPVAVLLASNPDHASSGMHKHAASPAQVHSCTAILTSLVLQRQGIEVQASSEVGQQMWSNAEADAPGSHPQIYAISGRAGDSALVWQRYGPAILWRLGGGELTPFASWIHHSLPAREPTCQALTLPS